MSDKHVFLIEDGEKHWYVASDEEDAFNMYNNDMAGDGETIEDVSITRLDDEMALTCQDEDDGPITQTCAEWIEEVESGFLGSTVL